MATLKQKKAFKKVLENHGNVSRAMMEAGYDLNTAKNPKNLTESKAWKELMDEYLPDHELARVHQEGLNAADELIIDGQKVGSKPDYAVRHKYLDSAYKLKGLYAPEKSQALNLNIKGDIKDFSELEAIRLKYEEELRAKLIKE